MDKTEDAFRTISEVAESLGLPQHVLRFWETRFPQIRPLKRGGGRRYYRPEDVELLAAIRRLLYEDGYTIRGVQRLLKEQGARSVAAMAAGSPSVEVGEVYEGGNAVAKTSLHEVGPTIDVAGFANRPPDPGAAAVVEFAIEPATAGAASTVALLSAGDKGKLSSALSELAECRRILSAAGL